MLDAPTRDGDGWIDLDAGGFEHKKAGLFSLKETKGRQKGLYSLSMAKRPPLQAAGRGVVRVV